MESALCTLLSALVVLLCSSPECKGEDTGVRCEELTALKPEVCAEQGKQVSLQYEYYKEPGFNDYFYWYRQYPGKPPEFLFVHLGKGYSMTEKVKGLEVSVRDKSVSLLLSSAAVGDSAVYYCAVRPTVTANPQSLNKKLLSSTHRREVELAQKTVEMAVDFSLSPY
ncbi:hypothetical protein WMY93_034127, partial [Mugilogobius chulae]